MIAEGGEKSVPRGGAASRSRLDIDAARCSGRDRQAKCLSAEKKKEKEIIGRGGAALPRAASAADVDRALLEIRTAR